MNGSSNLQNFSWSTLQNVEKYSTGTVFCPCQKYQNRVQLLWFLITALVLYALVTQRIVSKRLALFLIKKTPHVVGELSLLKKEGTIYPSQGRD